MVPISAVGIGRTRYDVGKSLSGISAGEAIEALAQDGVELFRDFDIGKMALPGNYHELRAFYPLVDLFGAFDRRYRVGDGGDDPCWRLYPVQ